MIIRAIYYVAQNYFGVKNTKINLMSVYLPLADKILFKRKNSFKLLGSREQNGSCQLVLSSKNLNQIC